MEIVSLTRDLEAAYSRFVNAHSAGLLYASLPYRNLLCVLLGCESEYVLALQNAEIQGVLPLMRAHGPFGDVLNSLPFYGSHGGILAHSRLAGDALCSYYNRLINSSKVAAATWIENPFDESPHSAPTYHLQDNRISQVTMLSQADRDRDQLLVRIDAAARRNVRKAWRAGIVVERDPSALPWLSRTHQSNMCAIGGHAKSDRFFDLVPEYFKAGSDYDLFVAYLNSEPIAALLVFYFGTTAEYFIPAILDRARSLQPLSAILVDALSVAAGRGMQRFNWGGTWTSQTGVYRFKRKWASQERIYAYYTHIQNRDLLLQSPESLLGAYPNFFVIPFSALEGGKP